jgi:hypothetical protein
LLSGAAYTPRWLLGPRRHRVAPLGLHGSVQCCGSLLTKRAPASLLRTAYLPQTRLYLPLLPTALLLRCPSDAASLCAACRWCMAYSLDERACFYPKLHDVDETVSGELRHPLLYQLSAHWVSALFSSVSEKMEEDNHDHSIAISNKSVFATRQRARADDHQVDPRSIVLSSLAPSVDRQSSSAGA